MRNSNIFLRLTFVAFLWAALWSASAPGSMGDCHTDPPPDPGDGTWWARTGSTVVTTLGAPSVTTGEPAGPIPEAGATADCCNDDEDAVPITTGLTITHKKTVNFNFTIDSYSVWELTVGGSYEYVVAYSHQAVFTVDCDECGTKRKKNVVRFDTPLTVHYTLTYDVTDEWTRFSHISFWPCEDVYKDITCTEEFSVPAGVSHEWEAVTTELSCD